MDKTPRDQELREKLLKKFDELWSQHEGKVIVSVQGLIDFACEHTAKEVEAARFASAKSAELQARANTYAEVADLVKEWLPLYKKLWDRRQATLKEMQELDSLTHTEEKPE